MTTTAFVIIWYATMMIALRKDLQARTLVLASAVVAAILAVTLKVIVWAGQGLATHIL